MAKLLPGQTITKQSSKQYLLDEHCDLVLREFINNCFDNNDDIVNDNNLTYFHHHDKMFHVFRNNVDKLLSQTIESYLISVGFAPDVDYTFIDNHKIKTTPLVFVKVLSAYDYDAQLANMLKNVLVY